MVKTTVKLPRDVWLAARMLALQEGTELQILVADALRAHLKNIKGSKK